MSPASVDRRCARGAVALVAAALAGLLACSPSKDRAPPADDCVDPQCAFDSGNGGGAVSTGGLGGATGGAGNGAGGRGTSGAGGAQVMSGSIRIFADTTFETTRELAGAGIVGLTGSVRITGTYETGEWTVPGAESGTLWADMHATVMGDDALDTLQVLDGPGAELVFASRSALETIFTGLSSVQSVSPDFAQIVLRFLDTARQPVAGVVVAPQPGVTIAYDAGNSYTDAKGAPFDATQNRGMAIVLNYTALPFPGGPIAIQYVKPGDTVATPIDLRAALGAVSFRTVVVN